MYEAAVSSCIAVLNRTYNYLVLLFSEEKEKGLSSDWYSSDEDDDSDSAAINPLCPSTHSALQAQWEWRAMGESLGDKWVKLINVQDMLTPLHK